MDHKTTLLWLRRDLRVADHPALVYAAARGRVVPVYILEPQDGSQKDINPWPLGGAARWWTHQALRDVGSRLESLGSPLVLRSGEPLTVLEKLVKETGADEVVWSRRYEPFERLKDETIEQKLSEQGLAVRVFNASLLFEPWAVRTKNDQPFKVFTPFAKACRVMPVAPPVPAPQKIEGVKGLETETLEAWGFVPSHPDWATGMRAFWSVGERAASERLDAFIEESLSFYKEWRDRPDLDGTSRLSPYLAVGQIGPRQIWHRVQEAMVREKDVGNGAVCFLTELLWREFSYHLLHHIPTLPLRPLQSSFKKFEWREDLEGLKAWRRGLTGYPIVDAGMRQLWQTGWMHNRVRMIVASFLVKDLLLPWQAGETWFWDTLVDADLASNAASWQWVAGCGADAAPYFRIFNPVLQGQKFDPNGDYVRHYVPELAEIEGPMVHVPWLMKPESLAPKGVVLGENYPRPIIDHAFARQRALAALKKSKET